MRVDLFFDFTKTCPWSVRFPARLSCLWPSVGGKTAKKGIWVGFLEKFVAIDSTWLGLSASRRVFSILLDRKSSASSGNPGQCALSAVATRSLQLESSHFFGKVPHSAPSNMTEKNMYYCLKCGYDQLGIQARFALLPKMLHMISWA